MKHTLKKLLALSLALMLLLGSVAALAENDLVTKDEDNATITVEDEVISVDVKTTAPPDAQVAVKVSTKKDGVTDTETIKNEDEVTVNTGNIGDNDESTTPSRGLYVGNAKAETITVNVGAEGEDNGANITGNYEEYGVRSEVNNENAKNDITVNGNVDVSAEYGVSTTVVKGESHIDVTGDVKNSGNYGVSANGSNNTITVDGGVEAKAGAKASNGGEITIKGDVTSTGSTEHSYGVRTTDEGSKITVQGSVTNGPGTGVIAKDGGTVTVGTEEKAGSVTGGVGVNASNNSTVTVNGSVTGKISSGVTADSSTVTVYGDVTSEEGTGIERQSGREDAARRRDEPAGEDHQGPEAGGGAREGTRERT